MTKQTIHIGFDDTDSAKKGCTTYIAAVIVEKLAGYEVEFVDYPNLIRLNPNVPWKTRGNGALCLRIKCEERHEERIKKTVVNLVEEHSDFESKTTDPGIVFLKGDKIPSEFRIFADKTTREVVTLKQALRILAKYKVEATRFKNGRGIIGGLAAIGETLQEDHTYELIAYRMSENRGKKRRVDESSIWEMDKATTPYTFNNVDTEKKRVIITPRGPDPILLGIRGETPTIVKRAFQMIDIQEPIERWAIFRTNQGTDAHLKQIKGLDQLEPFSAVITRGVVSRNPKIIPRRHVIFSIANESGQVDCAAYEPTGALRLVARELIVGDIVKVYGGVRASSSKGALTINLEKIHVQKLAPKIIRSNPLCQACGKRLKSMGKNQGLRCDKCDRRYVRLPKIEIAAKRAIKTGLYMTSTRSQRHLTKPFRRYGMEKRHTEVRFIDGWHSP